LPLDYWLALVTPDLMVSTADAYAALRLPLTNPTSTRTFRGWKAPNDLVKWLADIGNDFEPSQCGAFEEIRAAIEYLAGTGAQLVRMSGSGPTVFGIYYGMPGIDGDRVSGRTGWRISTVRPIRLPAGL
jgi:4-diphosphocytidyl-2-C-methyl-D-erythritol kinase